MLTFWDVLASQLLFTLINNNFCIFLITNWSTVYEPMQILMPYGLNSWWCNHERKLLRERETRIKMVQWHIVLKLCSRFSMASHLNYVVDWFSKLVSSISSSAVRGSDAIRRYHSWKIEARLTLIGSTVIFHCHSSRKKKKTWRKKTLVVQMVCTTTYIYSLTRKKKGMLPLVFCGFIRGIIFYSHK